MMQVDTVCNHACTHAMNMEYVTCIYCVSKEYFWVGGPQHGVITLLSHGTQDSTQGKEDRHIRSFKSLVATTKNYIVEESK